MALASGASSVGEHAGASLPNNVVFVVDRGGQQSTDKHIVVVSIIINLFRKLVSCNRNGKPTCRLNRNIGTYQLGTLCPNSHITSHTYDDDSCVWDVFVGRPLSQGQPR